MPRFAKNPQTGELIVFDQNMGDWRPASEAEFRLAGGGLAAKAEAALEGFTGIETLAGLVGLPGAAERAEALRGAQPDAMFAGEVAGLAALGGVAGKSVLGALAKRGTAARVAQKAEQGASAFKTSQGFIRQPEQLLPESLQGAGRMVRAGAETLPVTRVITDMLIRNPNRRNMNRLAGRALLLTDEEIKAAGSTLTDELVGKGVQRISSLFDEVGERITQNVSHDEVVQKALEANADGFITNRKLAQIADDKEAAGRSLMDIRSQLLKAQRAEQDFALKNQIENRIDDIDKIIESAIRDDGVTAKLYADARAHYRASLAIQKGQALGKTGDIAPASLDNALRNIYGEGYRQARDYSTQPQAIQDFLEGAREAQTVNVGLPSSGTAERAFAGSLLGGSIGVNF